MNKPIITIFLLLICLMPAFGDQTGMTIHRLQAGTADADGWYSAVSTNGSFSVRLPIPFNDFTNPGKDDGTKLCYTIGSQTSEGVKFSATRTPILKPRNSIRDFLNEFVDGFERSGELTGKNFLIIDGYESVDVTVKDAKATALFRLIGLPDGALIMIVEHPKNVAENVVRQHAAKFFASAKILKKKAEQTSTGQPATRPESKSEGSDNPHPEAEGSSR
jgi:hypothetical protein